MPGGDVGGRRRAGRASRSARQDQALALLLGHDLPAAQTARDFLGQFHVEELPLVQEGKASVPAEAAPLLGLATANAELVLDLQCRRPVTIATLDIDDKAIGSAISAEMSPATRRMHRRPAGKPAAARPRRNRRDP